MESQNLLVCRRLQVSAWPYFTAGGSTEGTGDAITNTSQADGAPMYATNRVGPAFLYDFGPINR